MLFKKIKKASSKVWGVSPDVSVGEAKTVMIGAEEIYVSGHRGLLEYTPLDIKLSLNDKAIRIAGEKLMIKAIEQEEISISGKIKSVEFL